VTLDVAPLGRPDLNQVATDPPNDFPGIPPHWLHLPVALTLDGEKGRSSPLGEGWLRWSRKHPKWKGGENAVGEWLAHARSLLLSARVA
jgi:hypothetical protein